jgi:EmrB/QacA subfamily drug resistance transporter
MSTQIKQLKGFGLFSILAALMLTLLLEALDQTIVGTAMPRIVEQFHGMDHYSWVVTAYILASVTMIPIVGKLSDQFGRKWFLLAGTILFLLGSLLAGASQNMNQLIIFRAVQGMGAGIGMALVFTVIADLFPPAERAKWQGLFGAVYGFSNLLGPTMGGWLTEHGFLLGNLVTESTRWRWVFYINLPVGLIAVAALFIYLPSRQASKSEFTGWAAIRRIDFAGSLLATLGTISLMLGLTLGSDQTYAWTSWQIISLLASSIIFFALFVVVERKAVEPILPLKLFRNQVFTASTLVTLLQMMVLMGLALYLPLFLQGVLGVAPTNAGLIMTPLSVSMVIGASVAGSLVGKLNRYQVIAIVSAVLMSVGTLLIALMTPSTAIWLAILYMVLTGIGTGVFFSLGMLVAQNALPQKHMGVGTAAIRYLGQIGATLGIAVVGTIVNSGIPGEQAHNLPTSEAGRLVLAGALQHGFIAVLVFAVLAIVVTLFLKDIPLVQTREAVTGELALEEERSENGEPEMAPR